MLIDAHCHPYDLFNTVQKIINNEKNTSCFLEDTLPDKKIIALGNACDITDLLFNEELAHNDFFKDRLTLLSSFGIHPQVFKIMNDNVKTGNYYKTVNFDEQLEILDKLASEKRIIAIGECGFDLFNSSFKETETIQERYFTAQIELSLRHELPLFLHVRRAMHKIFALSKILSKCKSVIFHSWSGTLDESLSLLKRKVNAYFSFGNTILLNHKQAINTCAHLPPERLLTETDAPYQMQRGEVYSTWRDLPFILDAIAKFRNGLTALDAEKIVERNFEKCLKIL